VTKFFRGRNGLGYPGLEYRSALEGDQASGSCFLEPLACRLGLYGDGRGSSDERTLLISSGLPIKTGLVEVVGPAVFCIADSEADDDDVGVVVEVAVEIKVGRGVTEAE
jgi:hypothetical protein